MEKLDVKHQMRSNKGITLMTLIITVVVMLILAGVGVSNTTQSFDDLKLKGFYSQLEIVQKRVDQIAASNETYIDDEGNTIYIMEQRKIL